MARRDRRSGTVITIIGAGSSYTPLIVNELAARRERLGIAEIRLHDIDRGRLEILAGFSRRLTGGSVPITATTRLVSAVDGADFVLTQFRVGGLKARHADIRLGLKYGLIGQETTGVGGFAKALRTIPQILKICDAMAKHSSGNAWLVNFTNPSGIITETVLKHTGIKCVGLCNSPFGMHKNMARALKSDPGDVEVDYVGSNHFGWIRGVRMKGKDVTARARRLHARYMAVNIPATKKDPVFERIISLPYNGYLNYYYYTDAMLGKLKAAGTTRAQDAMAIERVLLKKYAGTKLTAVPEELSKRGGAGYNLVAANIVDAIVNDTCDTQIVNTMNRGAIDGIEDDAVIEISCRVSRKGVCPRPFGKLDAPFRGLLQVVKAYEELAVRAGVTGDLEAALHALVVHPLGPTADTASSLLKEMIRINRRYLPQFSDGNIRRFFSKVLPA